MTTQQTSKAYASALYMLASHEQNLAAAIDDALQALAAALGDNPDWRQQQCDPLYVSQRGAMAATLVAQLDLPPLLARVFVILAKRGALADIATLAEAFSSARRRDSGHVQVEVRTATPPEESQRRQLTQLAQRLFGAQADVSWQVEASLLAGFVLRSQLQRLDASLAGRLRRLAQTLAIAEQA